MLPGGMVDPAKSYTNITNYQSENYDILTHLQEAIKYDHRIPGKSYNINNGLPILTQAIADHKGYVDADADGNFTVEIGKDGEPGHGYIHVGADDHIVLSVWTGAPLHGGSSVPIHINPSDLFMLADRLENNVVGCLMLAGEYIDIAIFTPRKYRDVQLYNIASTAILGEMGMLFNDIVFQLSNQQAKAIEGTVANSKYS